MTTPIRIVTHTDFDGVCSAVMLRAVLGPLPVVFTEPQDIQKGIFVPEPTDAVLDLPLAPSGCALWFDHHAVPAVSENPHYHLDAKQASCAGYIYRTYEKTHDLAMFAPLIIAVDKIDTASYTPDDIAHPDAASQISLTIKRDPVDDQYRRFLIEALGRMSIEQVAALPPVAQRYAKVKSNEAEYLRVTEGLLQTNGDILVADYTGLETIPEGSHFILFVRHPHAQYSIRLTRQADGNIKLSPGANPFTRPKRIDIGALMRTYGGGGHVGAGGCTIKAEDKENVLKGVIAAITTGRI